MDIPERGLRTTASAVTRRGFVASAFAAPILLGAESAGVDRSRISAITDEIARSPEDAIAFLKQYGLGLAELREVPGGQGTYDEDLSDDELHAAARQLSDAGIRVSFLDAGSMKYRLPGTEPVSWGRYDAEERAQRAERDQAQYDRRMEHIRKAINAARILGVDKVRVFGFARVAEPMKLLPRIAETLEPMIELAADARVQLLMENESSCNVGTSAELAELMKLLPSEWIGINWDAINGLAHDETPFPDGYSLLPMDRVKNVQMKGRSLLDYPERQDWKAIFAAFTRDGYGGAFGLETHIFGDGQIQASHDSMKEIIRILET